MMGIKSYSRLAKHIVVILLIFTIIASVFVYIYKKDVCLAENDAAVENSASFSTNVIYQIVTDRFVDGNSLNNPTGAIYDNHAWGSTSRNNRLYHGGDWAGITQKIIDGYFTEMGVSALWISSPIENLNYLDPADSSAAWTSASYHGYWGKDFFKTNPYFGTMNELQTLINTAHSNGIKIVIDFAPNHTSTSSDFSKTWDSAKYPEDGALYKNGTLVGKIHNDANNNYFNHENWVSDWDNLANVTYQSMYGLADLNQMNNTIDTYLKDSIKMWLDLGIDGIRVDAVKHMPLGWQKNWVNDVYSHKPVFIFGEWFSGTTSPDASMTNFANESGMSLLDFNLANATRNALGSLSGTMADVHNSVLSTASQFKQVNNQVTFIDNHDMSRFMTLANNTTNSVDTAYVLQLTQRGVPAIYYGTEQYLQGSSDPDNRADMPSFNRNSTAYKVIKGLAPLRKSNPALAYGTYLERWSNNDVLVYERQFGNSVVLTAVNRNSTTGYNLTNMLTNLPQGVYQDVLGGIKGGSSLTVLANGNIPQYYLPPGVSAVWQYTTNNYATPTIGNVDPLMGIVGNNVTITGRGFGNNVGSVTFGTTIANVVDWSNSRITVKVPNVLAGNHDIKVKTSNNISSYTFPGFKVLSGAQTAVRFKVNNATTNLGQNIYLVGNIDELGSWNADKAIGPMFNSINTIGVYPTWFFDVSVPKGKTIEIKFIKKDASGNVIWEGGSNHIFTTTTSTSEVIVNWQN